MRRLGAPLVALGVLISGGFGPWRAAAQPGPAPSSLASVLPGLPSPTPVAPSPAQPAAKPPSLAPAGPAPSGSAAPTPAAEVPAPMASGSGGPAGASPAPPAAGSSPAPGVPAATQPPIFVDPAAGGVTPGGSQTLRISQVLGTIAVSVANPALVAASVDQDARTLTLVGKAIGSTTVTVTDARGLSREVPVRVAYPAGDVAASAEVRLTGNPASPIFVREQAVAAAVAAANPRTGATVVAAVDAVSVARPLRVDDVTTVDVPLILQGQPYFTVQGTTRVRVENDAQPSVPPHSLLVSDFPETLRENGILFSAELTTQQSERFLYYHYNPAGQPDRRIVLKARNPSGQPARVQFIVGDAGPDGNEMAVGHASTQRFLVRRTQNEGSVVTIPGNATMTLSEQALPARSIVSALMQLHEIEGAPLHLTLVAQDASDPVDGPLPASALLVGDKPHARGIYPIPEFFFDYNYDTEGPDLEIPIGQIPLPNLVHGQTLAGDYGVLQSVTVRIVNNDRRNARQIALYASPRGGKATGTFVIDRVLVQAHAMAPFAHYKLRQYTIPPASFVRTEIVTMPEGGSSYPLRLVVAPDDGSAAPGSSDSPIY